MTILVIGGGPAGTFAAIAAKKQNPSADVTLITDEACEPYEKPPLSKAVLLGTVLPADAPIAGPSGIASHGVSLEGGVPCTAIDRGAREVVLADGRRLPYDALVLATGSLNREVPSLPAGMPRVHYLRTEADAHALKTALGSSRELAVVGGGLIGLEVAASAATIGRKVTVLEVAPRILWRVCDEETGSLIHEAHRSHGVDIRVGTALARVEPRSDGGFVLHTVPHPQIAGSQEHQQVSADLIVVGTGAKPDDRLALASGLTVDDGIVVDESCRTSDAAIFAAGDAVRFPGPHGSVRLENWRHAQDQGTIAGRNAAGAHEAYTTVPSFWSEQYDLYVQGVGWPTPGAARVRRPMPAPAALIFEITDGHLTYAMGVNAQRDLSMVRRLMERKIPVDAAALADPSASLQGMLKR